MNVKLQILDYVWLVILKIGTHLYRPKPYKKVWSDHVCCEAFLVWKNVAVFATQTYSGTLGSEVTIICFLRVMLWRLIRLSPGL